MDDNEYKIMEIADSFRRKYNFQSGEELEKYKDEFIEKIKENNLIYDRATEYILTENNYHTPNRILKEVFT
jgi:hypothetical protein